MSQPLVAVIDYGMGNLRSVLNALHEVGGRGALVAGPEEFKGFDKVILPGVGAFAEAMDNLRTSGIADALNGVVAAGKDLLGICLGMQLMCLDSQEHGRHQGLGWIRARVLPFPRTPEIKVPHVGWNAIEFRRDDPILRKVETGSDVYFVHGYYVDCEDEDDVLASTEYGVRFVSIFGHDNVYGMQFHPEKSQSTGLQLLRNFATL